VNAAVQTADGVYTVDLDEEEVIGFEEGTSLQPAAALELVLPSVVAAAAAGSTIAAVTGRRPPLLMSYDAGRTWRESGGGLPAGRAVAVAEDDPDVIVFAARNRLYLSRDGGRFWHALLPELPEILRVELR
jgi:photosystem II stability/assembly factor-like uncharacterized protein